VALIMAKSSADDSQTEVPPKPAGTGQGEGGSSPKLKALDSNPQGASGPRMWQAFRDTVLHLYDTVSLPEPAEEARFTLATRTYPMPRSILLHNRGTAFTMTRGPALIARGHGPDQLLIFLQVEGTCHSDCGGKRLRIEPGDIAVMDYARPFRSAVTDYANLMIIIARESVPAALLAIEPHGLVFPRESGAARLIGAALQELYAQADDLTVSDAEAAVEGILALTTACARAKLAGDEADHVKSRRKAALDYIDAHLGEKQLGPDEIAAAAHVSRASLYRLLAAEGGIRAVLLTRRLDQALRLMMADNNDERSLTDIARVCGFGGTSQFSRAFRARFGVPPRQYLALVRQQDDDWLETRMVADGFDSDAFKLWRQQGLSKSPADGTWHAPVRAAKQSSDVD
jgi:AraC-like DNA-binding protein